MAYFTDFQQAKYHAERLYQQEMDAAIIKYHEQCGGSGLTEPGRGDTSPGGINYNAKEAAVVVARQRRNDKVAAAYRHFSDAQSRYLSEGNALAPHAQHWLETGQADPPPPAPKARVLFYDRRGGDA